MVNQTEFDKLKHLFFDGGIRPGILMAAGHMESKLREKDSFKPVWENGEVHISEKIMDIITELREAEKAVDIYLKWPSEGNALEAVREFADVMITAMICMSYFDVEMGKLQRGK